MTLYGCTDSDPEAGSYLTTYYFVILGIPIFPICRYRVTRDGTSYRFFGKAPLRTFDKWHLAISIGLIVWLIIALATAGDSRSSSNPRSYTPPSTYSPPPSDGGGDASTHRVPSSISSELNRDRQAIETAETEAKLLATQLESLAQEIDRERHFLDQTSQFAVDAFNRKVNRYNSMLEQARGQDRLVNRMVDEYNAKLRRSRR
jgi:hypothetical protein